MRIATWNVNSIKARLPIVTRWLEDSRPDLLLMQETKSVDNDFPLLELRGLGYHVEMVGQKSYNGVAVLSRQPVEVKLRGLPGDEGDPQARYLEIDYAGLRVASLYLPNGNPIATDKFTYKLTWMERLRAHAAGLLKQDIPFVLGGDYNVCPTDDDVYDPLAFRRDALCQPESRRKYRELVHLGLTDAYRAVDTKPHAYSFWDYQAGCWPRDEGLRIDHLLLSPQAADRLVTAAIDKVPRGWDRASDHTPVWCELEG